ncbi:outer membrane receptor for ferrienterochelin and colicins [Shewanella psychrophila]|uniref:Outer membrane receptor for ferrienterochelin and colicins n=1 Tax=Shewanella psychrophila TaxID=225848 RepID=A0A1S6HVH6_9GAMM|nr:TonB-dependent receptor [Shewanella psychrophila]AQS39567.1 outer membrane receptor for ferrienterochelin and colicins [Shewanella psychrophila]
MGIFSYKESYNDSNKLSKIAMLISSVLTLSVVSSSAMAAEAANTGESQANSVDEVITVIGRSENTPLNIAANVNIIDSAQIEMSGATTLTEVLRGQSGIQISDSNSNAVFAMRGFSGSQAANNTLILVDGRRLNNIDIAAPSINAIPLNQIDRVEILSGSAGVLYGDQAVGGVINIITKAPTGSGGGIQLSGGSFNTYEGKADVSGAINDTWRYYAAASYNQGDNYRDHNANKTSSVLGRLQYEDGPQDFFVEASYYDNDRELAGALTKDQIKENPRQSNATQPGAYDAYMHEMTTAARSGYTYQLNDEWSLGADVNYSDTLITGLNEWGSSRKDTRSLLEFTPKAVANITTDKGDLKIITGIDLSRGESEFGSGRGNVQKQASAYVQATVPLSESFSYVVGGRYAEANDELVDPNAYPEGIKLDQDAHAFELGLNYRPTATQRLYVRADDNFRFAKVDEQAYTPANVIGLKPQTGRSYEAGWDWAPESHTLRLSAYRLDLEDEIVFDPSADTPTGGSFPGANVNADASRRYGVSADWDWQLTDKVQLGAEYNYIDAEFTDGLNEGKQLSWVAEHTGRGYFSIDANQNWQVFTEVVYTGERFIEGDNSNTDEKLEAYWLTNLAVNYTKDAWLASFRVDNLFDEQYVSAGYYSNSAGVSYNGYYAGTGRALRLTGSYRF